MSDPFDLRRFEDAQNPVIEDVRQELAAGRKRSHWMWFVFPQLAGLGMTEMSRRYAISGLTEARAYLAHPLLGPRLRELTVIVNSLENRSANDIFGSPDDLKFRSCMTLFAEAALNAEIFQAALAKYFEGSPDRRTLEILEKQR